MKTKILYSITALLILTFAFVVYASVGSATPVVAVSDEKCCAMKDCCKDGKCSMSKDGKCSCTECCKDGKCSMNSDCCKDGVCKMGCCKDGKCEMHKKDGEANAKGGCCKGDSCQMHKGENKDKPKTN